MSITVCFSKDQELPTPINNWLRQRSMLFIRWLDVKLDLTWMVYSHWRCYQTCLRKAIILYAQNVQPPCQWSNFCVCLIHLTRALSNNNRCREQRNSIHYRYSHQMIILCFGFYYCMIWRLWYTFCSSVLLVLNINK